MVKKADNTKLFLSFKAIKNPKNTEVIETKNIDHIIIFISSTLTVKLSPKSFNINNLPITNPPTNEDLLKI